MTKTYCPRKPLDREKLFAWLTDLAKCGARMPTSDYITQTFGEAANVEVRRLARVGLIIIEVDGHNWRVVKIGKHQTAPFPNGWTAYRRIDKNGDAWLRDGKWVLR